MLYRPRVLISTGCLRVSVSLRLVKVVLPEAWNLTPPPDAKPESDCDNVVCDTSYAVLNVNVTNIVYINISAVQGTV